MQREGPPVQGEDLPSEESPDEAAKLRSEWEAAQHLRPKARGDCVKGPRPCPWYSCWFHLGLDVDAKTGRAQLRIAPDDLFTVAHTCSLDLADKGDVTLEFIGRLLGVTKERIRQVESLGLRHMRRTADRTGVLDDAKGEDQ